MVETAAGNGGEGGHGGAAATRHPAGPVSAYIVQKYQIITVCENHSYDSSLSGGVSESGEGNTKHRRASTPAGINRTHQTRAGNTTPGGTPVRPATSQGYQHLPLKTAFISTHFNIGSVYLWALGITHILTFPYESLVGVDMV
ncbi:hypothetical protein Pmani_001086 [Petrolisthes manimaculis]|uniref:Uncharacterized protein n=1 Tax=Petrolisthes manimaculis TaxID=1843537 RepID=A0AAE1QKN9_9EUCA|nr:hypothetical protein Pmani_001086 [Petrolisthes manimaculis]